MKQALMYSLKVWLTTIIISPIAWIIVFAVCFGQPASIPKIAIYALSLIPIYFVALLPHLFLLWLCSYLLTHRQKYSLKSVCLMLTIIAIGLVVATFLYLKSDAHNFITLRQLVIVSIYGMVAVYSVWYYKNELLRKHLKLVNF